MKTPILLLISTALLTASGWTATDLDPFVEFRELKTKAHGRQLCAAPIPKEIYRHLNAERSNLRIIDTASYLLPHRIQPSADREAVKTTQNIAGKVKSISIGDGNEMQVFVTRTAKDAQVSGITIQTRLQDYEQTVHIHSRPNGDSPWTPLVTNALIFDYSRFMNVRHNRVNFPKTTDAEFRIAIEQAVTDRLAATYEVTDRDARTAEGGFAQTRRMVKEQPFKIDRIQLWQTTKAVIPNRSQTTTYPPQKQTNAIDKKSGHAVTTFDMANEPLSAINFTTAETNFSQTARVAIEESTQIGPKWRDIAVGRLFSIGQGASNQRSLSISFAECTPTRIRVTVENGSQAPIIFSKIEPRGVVYETQFVAPADGNAAMYYGGTPERIDFDLSPIEHLYSTGSVPIVIDAGPAQANPGHAPTTTIMTVLGHRVFFGAAVTLVVLGLAWALFRAAKQLPESPESE